MIHISKFKYLWLFTAVTLGALLNSCSSAPVKLDRPQRPGTSSNSISQEDQERLSLYKEVLSTLKSTPNPQVDEDYNVVTSTDVQAAQDRRNGSATAYNTESSGAGSTYSAGGSSSYSGSYRESYADPKPSSNAWFQQYHSDHAIQEAYKAQEALNRGDIAAAREHAKWARANVENYRSYGER